MSRIIDALAKVEDVQVRTDYEGNYQVCFEDSWMKDGAAKTGIYGVGRTVEDAARDYLRKIGGHRIVIEMEKIKCEYIIIEFKSEIEGGEKDADDGPTYA